MRPGRAEVRSAVSAPSTAETESGDDIKTLVARYWNALGLDDPGLVSELTEECLGRARRRGGREPGEDGLLARAIEESRRLLDQALARALNLPPSRDSQSLSSARAALLAGESPNLMAAVLRSENLSNERLDELRRRFPCPTPPEARLKMSPVPLRFWLFRSTHP